MENLIGHYVIVRCRDAGVHSGVLVEWSEREVHLRESRRLWYYQNLPAANGRPHNFLSGIARFGVAPGSKLGCELKYIVLLDACEIIPTTAESEKTLREFDEFT